MIIDFAITTRYANIFFSILSPIQMAFKSLLIQDYVYLYFPPFPRGICKRNWRFSSVSSARLFETTELVRVGIAAAFLRSQSGGEASSREERVQLLVVRGESRGQSRWNTKRARVKVHRGGKKFSISRFLQMEKGNVSFKMSLYATYYILTVGSLIQFLMYFTFEIFIVSN